jgi:hypothetical protein
VTIVPIHAGGHKGTPLRLNTGAHKSWNLGGAKL